MAATSEVGDDELLLDSPFCRVYKDWRVERPMGPDVVAAGSDDATGVASKDVVIDAGTGVFVRLYLPDLSSHKQDADDSSKRLPVLLYFHGGGFVVGGADSGIYHTFINSLASKLRVLVVSVNYRLAPEHPLPAAYEDSLAALDWLFSGRDPWLAEHGDLSRLFLAGDSAGGNIAHYVTHQAGMRGGTHSFGGRIEGAIMLHSGYGGEERVDGEPLEMWEFGNRLWSVVCPSSKCGLNDPWMNPTVPGAPSLALLGCERLLVCAAGKDTLYVRNRLYYDAVVASGWPGRAEWFESEGEEHVFFIMKPTAERTLELLDRLNSFINDGGVVDLAS